MSVIVIELQPPLVEGRAAFYAVAARPGGGFTRTPLAERRPEADLEERLADAVAAGHDRIIIDLELFDEIVADDISRLTSFVWTVRAEGAASAILIENGDVADAVRHNKMDRAFEVFDGLEEAVEHLEN